MRATLEQGLPALGLGPELIEPLETFSRMLLEKNQVMNLTAITDPRDVAVLHLLDSLALTGLAGLEDRTVVDVGTGAGFPGMVLKILEPSISLTLVDSLGKRVVWLEKVCEALSLDGVRCLHARAEELALDPGFRDGFDVAVSRAVAAFPALCELCLPYTKVGGRFAAMKSVESNLEIASGATSVERLGGKQLEAIDYPIPGAGVTHRLVPVKKISPTPKGLPRSWGKIKKTPL